MNIDKESRLLLNFEYGLIIVLAVGFQNLL